MDDVSERNKRLSLAISPVYFDEENANFPLQGIHTPSSPTVQYFRSIFDKADTDHDDFITVHELKIMIRKNRLTEPPLPTPAVDRIYQIADTNHDGQLDFQEFVDMINDPNFNTIFGRYVNIYVNFVIPRKKFGSKYRIHLYEDQYSCRPPKLGMILISLIELIFFLIDEFNEKNSTNFASGLMARWFIYDPSKRYEIWRYFTYMFVHIGSLHLTVNLVFQIFIGIPLEMVHGWWRVLLIYFTGVVGGSLATSVTDPTVKLAGASGGVYSLITAHIATIFLNWKESSFPGVQLIIFLLIIGVDLCVSIYNRYWANFKEHIGYEAHIAGSVAGLLVGIVVLRNLKLTKKENVMWWVAVALYVALMFAGICWNIFYSGYFPEQT